MPFFSARCRTSHPVVLAGQAVGDLAGPVGRAVVDDQDPEGAAERAIGGGACKRLAGGAHDCLDVLGLVVGREDQPRLAGHESAYPSVRVCSRPLERRHRRRAGRARRPVRARRRDRPSRTRLPQRGKERARVLAVGRRAGARRTRQRAAGDRRDARGEDPRAGRDGAIPAAEKLRAKFPPGLVALTRLPGLGAQARASAAFDELGVDSLDTLRAGGAGATHPDRARARRRSSRRRVLVALEQGAGERPEPRLLLPRRSRSASRSRPALRELRRRGTRVRARRLGAAAGPTASRTSTSSP